jgi:pimeloyl-ACP methyl ester carboxylesterase
MLTDPVSLSIAPASARLDTCELCATGPESLQAWIVVRHARGGSVQFAACARCGRAVRRIIAVAGGGRPAGRAQVAARSGIPPAEASVELAAIDLVGTPVLIHRFSEPFVSQDGTPYTVEAYGQERSDRTWIGWLEFVGQAGQTVRRTGRETTQSNREQLTYWATGLEPIYFKGALVRAS